MPPFLLPDETGRLVSLTSLLEKGPVAVMFYRGHWCPYCRLNVRAVIQAQDRIRALGAQTVAIMPETQQFAEKFKADASAPFPVLTDLDNGYALSLNLAIWLGSEIQRSLHELQSGCVIRGLICVSYSNSVWLWLLASFCSRLLRR